MMFEGFETDEIAVSDDVTLFVKSGGEGEPVLLLHGFPQNHLCWHKVAPNLAEKGFRVIVPDLTGYGSSSKPKTDDRHTPYTKKMMASDQTALMSALGHQTFHLAGHDRGGRVAHKLAVDYPDRVKSLAVLDIAPTLTMYDETDQTFATGYYHWFFLIQPAPLPERLIGADPEFYLRHKMGSWMKTSGTFSDEVMQAYIADYSKPETIHASCEDYRAAATTDLDHARADLEAGRLVQCPILSLWGAKGFAGTRFDMIKSWKDVSNSSVTGKGLDCGHFLPEERPEETTAELLALFRQ